MIKIFITTESILTLHNIENRILRKVTRIKYIEDVEKFMKSRFENQQSKVFIATSENDEVIGFIQLYPSYSTVSLKPQWVLNDFYVDKNYRKQGYGTKLMEYVKAYFKDSAKGFILVTDKDNVTAKSLYDKNGWETGEYDFYTYFYK